MTTTATQFDLVKLLSTVFQPIEGLRVCILIDLDDPQGIKNFAYLNQDGYSVQKHAYYNFYQALKDGGADELGLTGGDIFAYKTTGGSNLDLPDDCVDPEGNTHSLEEHVYPNYGLILCISDYSATAPLTAHAKKYFNRIFRWSIFRNLWLCHGMANVVASRLLTTRLQLLDMFANPGAEDGIHV